MRPRVVPILLAAGAVALWAGAASADVVTRKDGTVLTGRIIAEDDREIRLQMDRYGAKVIVNIPRKDVQSIVRREEAPHTRPAPTPATEPAGPAYYPLPIVGTLGIEVTGKLLRQVLNVARVQKSDYVVLYFDSPGGTAAEMEAVLGVLSEYKDLRTVALIRRALGTAAVVAFACRDVYLTPDGAIGAITLFTPEGKDLPADPKLRAALRARCRAAAQMGGHSDLILRGMMEPELELAVVQKDGRPVVVEGGPDKGKVVKEPGALLTLTAKEAAACGLAKGAAENMETLRAAMGIDEWHQTRGGGWYLMIQRGKENRRQHSVEQWQARKEAYLKSIADDVKRIDRAVDDARAKGRRAEKARAALLEQQEQEERLARREYWAERSLADRLEEQNPTLAARLRARARENYDFRLLDIRRRYQADIAQAESMIDRLAEEIKRLLAEKKRLLDAVPKYEPPPADPILRKGYSPP